MGAALTNRPSMATGTDEVTARVTAEGLYGTQNSLASCSETTAGGADERLKCAYRKSYPVFNLAAANTHGHRRSEASARPHVSLSLQLER
jgi:hypothetical protein